MTCVNCQCDQQHCYSFCEYDRLLVVCGNPCERLVTLVPNATLGKGTPLTRTSSGDYTLFDPSATPPQRFAGLLAVSARTDADGYVYFGQPWHPAPGLRQVPMYISGTFDLRDLDATTDQLNAIVAQGRGYIDGDVNTRRGVLHLY
ncbi:MAG: hypothetical protein RML84_09250 [Anaerolineae bacterium]|nr:hypothetical protein [Anaerolineae bacterium]